MNTRNIKLQLKHENSQWKLKFSDNLHNQARRKMESLTEYFRSTMGKLNRKVVDLDSLRFVMNLLKEVRARESGINMEINPVLDMYEMLEYYLPDGFMEKEEMDQSPFCAAIGASLSTTPRLAPTSSARLRRGSSAVSFATSRS